mmetsp:Transcript_17847/g.38850  ORF Transcript_17847/g.38850 Transcript_17847/m.38850 type:complete len:386 (-) Transcript_17847:203-1360(-)
MVRPFVLVLVPLLATHSFSGVKGFVGNQAVNSRHGDLLKLSSSFSSNNNRPVKNFGKQLAQRAGLGTYNEDNRRDGNVNLYDSSSNIASPSQQTRQRGAPLSRRPNSNNSNRVNSYSNNRNRQSSSSTRIFPERSGGSQYKSRSKAVQGSSLKTWSFLDPNVERVRVVLETDGRPLNAEVDLWEGPDNTPYKMRAYVENGKLCPFNIVIDTPSSPNTVAVRNRGLMEFPLSAYVAEDEGDYNAGSASLLTDPQASNLYTPRVVQGGAVRAFPMDSFVENVQVLLKSDGRPLNARVEFLQGPNNVKQVIEFYADDGLTRPLYAVIETPGSGNVVRIVNRAPMEYPLVAWVEPLMVGRPVHDESGGFTVDGVLEPWYEVATRSPMMN